MKGRETEFLQRLRATFLVEAREHLQVIASSLLALEKARSPNERAAQLEIAFRHTHSLKGAARAADFPRIEAVCQGIEEVFALCKRRGRILASGEFDVLYRAFDLVTGFVDAGGAAPAGSSVDAVQEIARSLQAIAAGARGEVEPSRPVSTEWVLTQQEAVADPARYADLADAAGSDASATELAAASTIRVATAQLDRILLSVEELLTVKQAVMERADELERLERHLLEWGSRWLATQPALRQLQAMVDLLPAEARGKSTGDSPERVAEFVEWTFGHLKALESRLRHASRTGARDRHLAAKHIDELLEESKGLLMLPLSTVTDALPRLVRDLAHEQKKEIDLRLAGTEARLDKRILEHLKDPLVHLVRNAIDHGIERPAVREAAGKPGTATLLIEANQRHGGRIEIVVSDDGGGFDPLKLRNAAVHAGLLGREAADALDDAAAIELAFRSDVSTSPIITEISGRGLGLAIVREHITKLGGRVTVENRAPNGAVFMITLPQMLATVRGVFVQAGGQPFAIPSAHVDRVMRCAKEDVRTVSGRETVPVDGATVPLVRLHELLGAAPAGPAGGAPVYVTAVVIGSDRERIALAVDDVLNEDEMLVKRLRRPLVRVRNVAGATVLPSGKVVPVLNVADLAATARQVRDRALMPDSPAAGGEDAIVRKILVAEDSITSRLLLRGILEAAGCEVKTVVDGVEAFTALRSEYFDLLVSDIEMPRLNGFDLTARIRADRQLADLPVILVTALASREDRERGIDVGANAYITKGGFDQDDLLEAVRRLAGLRSRA